MVFQDGQIFKITSDGHGALALTLKVEAHRTRIITSDYVGGNNQKWVAKRAVGGYLLTTLADSLAGVKKYLSLTDNDKSNSVVYREEVEGYIQQWQARLLIPSKMSCPTMCRVINAEYAQALTSHGYDSVTIETQDPASAAQHWMVDRV